MWRGRVCVGWACLCGVGVFVWGGRVCVMWACLCVQRYSKCVAGKLYNTLLGTEG